MRHLIILLVHLIATVLRVVRPGGVRAVVAESALAKHQLLILNRSRRRPPNLSILDRLIAGFCSLWIKGAGLPARSAWMRTSGSQQTVSERNWAVWKTNWAQLGSFCLLQPIG